MSSRLIRRAMLCPLILAGVMFSACGGGGEDPSEPTDVTTDIATELTRNPTAIATTTAEATEAQTPEPTPTSDQRATAEAASPVATEMTATRQPPTPGPTPTIPPVPTRLPPPPPASVEGEGTNQSAVVTFPSGVSVVTMNHQGPGRFTVRLQNLDQSFDRAVGQGSGTWKGSTGIFIRDPGEYRFAVEATGSWQIDVMWPTPESAPVAEVPYQQSGTGDQAVYFVLVRTGSHTTSLTHDGEGNYSVETITSEGRRYINKFHGTGQTSTSAEFSLRGKAFEFLLFNIQANGNWTIRVE